MALAHARYDVVTARRITSGGFVAAGSNQEENGSRLLPAGDCSALGKPSGPYFGAVPPLPVVVAGVVVAGVLPRRTSRRS